MPRILVIDDSAVQRVLNRALLEAADFEVADAVDGKAGLAMAASENFDCILLDWLMPEVSGQEVLQTLQERGNQVPVIVVTGDPDESTRAECTQLGAAAVIDKIQNQTELAECVQAVLRADAG